jgi:hypothetical protein
MTDPLMTNAVGVHAVPRSVDESPAAAQSDALAQSGRNDDEVVALVAEHAFHRTLATGLTESHSPLGIAAVHEQRDEGQHILIEPDETRWLAGGWQERLELARLAHRVRVVAMAPELALPELLRERTQLDFALIQGPKTFEDAFLEFLYLDRMLVNGGMITVGGLRQDAVTSLVEYVTLARAYEQRTATRSTLTVLRKLGRHSPRDLPVPQLWRNRGDRDLGATTSFGTVPSAADDAAGAATLLRDGAATRELFLARTRAAELEGRARTLAARLLEAEEDSAREIAELRSQRDTADAAHARAEYWLGQITSSPSWRLTAPLRLLKKHTPRRPGR